MSVQNSVRSFIGIAKETTKGTAVVPTDYLLVMSDSVKPVDVIDPLYDKGLRGALVDSYNYIPGRTRSTFDFSSAGFPDGIGYALTGLLGACATTGASAPFTHTISLKNSLTAAADAQPLSYTITDFYAAAVRAYPGLQFTDFSLKFNADGLLEYDAKTTGFASACTYFCSRTHIFLTIELLLSLFYSTCGATWEYEGSLHQVLYHQFLSLWTKTP